MNWEKGFRKPDSDLFSHNQRFSGRCRTKNITLRPQTKWRPTRTQRPLRPKSTQRIETTIFWYITNKLAQNKNTGKGPKKKYNV